MNETNQDPATGGTKLSTIFMVVLGLHIVVIVVISAFYFMKGRSHPEMAEANPPALIEGSPLITADSIQAPGTPTPEPVLETNNAPMISSEMIDTMANAEPQSSMPASTDPVWATASNEPARSSVHQDDTVAAMELQAPPARLVMEPKTLTAPAPAKKSPVVSAAKPKTYLVAAGDNLTKIARKTGVSVAVLKKTNGLASDSLKVGQVLKVPGSVSATKAVASKDANIPSKKFAPIISSSSAASSSYRVSPGDNLTKIAKKNNTTVAKIKQANGLTADNLQVGQVLKVPAATATKATPKADPMREADASTPVKKPFRAPVITMDMARL